MVQILPTNEDSANAFRNIGAGVIKGYTNRADELAIQNTLQNLGSKATMRETLDAIMGTSTYNPESKERAVANFAKSHGVDLEERRFQEELRKNKKSEELKEKQIESSAKKAVNQAHKTNSENNLKAGLQTIAEMKALGKKGNLGRGSQYVRLLGGETAKDYGQYEQLGKSLISLASNIPIRNRQEFETLAHKLYDPSLPDKEREGILDAMENVIKRNLMQYESGQETPSQSENPQGKVRVRNKQTGETGSVTPFKGMESKYERI